ncbi:hypothetical protein HAX54_024365, partial [Datura stramonium]|nr:hypothetical protein [Datura stramonium]
MSANKRLGLGSIDRRTHRETPMHNHGTPIVDPIIEPPVTRHLRNRGLSTNTRKRKGKVAERRYVLVNRRYITDE